MNEPDYQSLFDGLCAERGGPEKLSKVHIELIGLVVRLLLAARDLDGGDAAKTATTVSGLLASLPAPVAAASEPEPNLALLSDAQFSELEKLSAVAHGQAPPEPLPIEPERERGLSEIIGEETGRWIDTHCENWAHRGLSEAERDHLRGAFQSMSRHFICRNLWSDVFRASLESEIANAVRNALSAVGSDARILSRDEQKAIEPPPPKPPVVTLLNGIEFCAQINAAGRGR